MRIRDEHKESAIRQKAIEMIVTEGFDGLSMQKLAKAACVSPATIYIYFKNREDLLNQLYNEVQQTFSEVALKNFTPELPFKEGLWLQWQNRLEFIEKYPMHFKFHEQFRNSPLVHHEDVKLSDFKETMKRFLTNAVKRGEISQMQTELFWCIAYGSFYSLVKFHLNEKSMSGRPFTLTDSILKKAFEMVLKALKP